MLSEKEVRAMHPLRLAYIGDGVFSLIVRLRQLESPKKLNLMHKETVRQVCASAQAEMLRCILPTLNDEEKDLVRRARNARSGHHAPKSATEAEYSAATAFEALFGFLYLTGNQLRIDELYALCNQSTTTAGDEMPEKR